MYYFTLWCVLLLTLGPLVQVRGSHLKTDKNVQLQYHKDKLKALFNTFLDTSVNTLYQRHNDILKTIEENVAMLKKLPQMCSSQGNQETEIIKSKAIRDFDYCYNLTTQLHAVKQLLYNGTDLFVEISLDISDIVTKLTVCNLKPYIQQLGCFLNVIQILDDDVQTVVPEVKNFLSSVISTTTVLLADLTNCYIPSGKLKENLEEITNAASVCSLKYKFLTDEIN
ncbi:uncharacterized protein LOC142318842 [Lycorma delicatula]|uniref:uncharacterized protein LOC142318842 n=1 Tax=Lycorma delicatula TaxID=130591 RepID=UPI003F511D53